MSKFTPGPWSVKCGQVSMDITALSKRGKVWTIARTTAAKVGRDQADANVRLIAAAPELLEMLDKLAHETNYAREIAAARALLARINGDK